MLADTLKVAESDLRADALASFLAFLVVCSVETIFKAMTHPPFDTKS